MCDPPRRSGHRRADQRPPAVAPAPAPAPAPAAPEVPTPQHRPCLGHRGLQLSSMHTARTCGAGGWPCLDEDCGPGEGPGRKLPMALRGLMRRSKPLRGASRPPPMSPSQTCQLRFLRKSQTAPPPRPVVGGMRPSAKMHVPSSLEPGTVSPHTAEGLVDVIRLGTSTGTDDPGSWGGRGPRHHRARARGGGRREVSLRGKE